MRGTRRTEIVDLARRARQRAGVTGYLDATRAGYDAIAADYDAVFARVLDERPFARAVLGAFAEVVRGPVLEVGSGPGRVTAHLRGLGVDVRGIDLSPAMVALARSLHPGVPFAEGTMTALDVADGSLGGLVAWYSLIHIPPADRGAVLAGFHRALAPGAHLLLAFQLGDDVNHDDEAFGHRVDLDFHRMRPDLLDGCPFDVRAR